MAEFRIGALRASPEAAAIFLDHDEVPAAGFRLQQIDLAMTLETIAQQGAAGFYQGVVAEQLVRGVREADGIWTLEDLANYRVIERKPIISRYGDLKITSAPPPSSGGIALMTMLNVLSGYDLKNLEPTTRTHLIIEAMRRAYRDRALYLGDPDFVEIPVDRLISPDYAAGLRAAIHPQKATPSANLPGIALPTAGTDTTHFSVIDREGNRVAATLTINYPFGSGFVPRGTGVLLNDEMDDFSAKPGVPNVYGLIGNEANAIAPGKRPLSSMTPTFIESERGVAVLGTPGGSRIISMVLLALLDYAGGGNAVSMAGRYRFHHQYLPDIVQYEAGTFTPGEISQLEALGHHFEAVEGTYGNLQVVLWNRRLNQLEAASDPRVGGAAEVRFSPSTSFRP
jgi:gamma-glutamyltranspeptidase/glutathione hydrolase